MGRSTEIRLSALLIAGLTATAAQARGMAPFAPHPMAAFRAPMMLPHRPMGQHVLDPRNPGLTIGQTIITQGRQPRRRFFGGGLGYDGAFDSFGYGGATQPAATDAGPPQPYAIPAPPAPCLPPQIIKIDGGLAHPAKTRVVYGTPACGGY